MIYKKYMYKNEQNKKNSFRYVKHTNQMVLKARFPISKLLSCMQN